MPGVGHVTALQNLPAVNIFKGNFFKLFFCCSAPAITDVDLYGRIRRATHRLSSRAPRIFSSEGQAERWPSRIARISPEHRNTTMKVARGTEC